MKTVITMRHNETIHLVKNLNDRFEPVFYCRSKSKYATIKPELFLKLNDICDKCLAKFKAG